MSAEDRATLAEHERLQQAWEVEEILIPGYGIWTKEALKKLLDKQDVWFETWREMGLL